jgi:hypothetical protein
MERKCLHCGHEVTVVGVLFCPFCKKSLVKFDPAPPPPPPEEPIMPVHDEKKFGEDRARARSLAWFMSIVFYLCLLWANADPVAERKLAQVLGPAPLGMSPVVCARLLETGLFLPFPWVIYHFGLIIFQERRDGLSPSLLSVLEVDQRHPHLTRSKWICIGGIVYFVLVCGTRAVVSVRAGG